ncbi:MAG: hypothetical protein USCAAHI_00562 [Beijerinckiaceae bacterium]|nr:MAG: hypothetical protein USCAAHI_00562 [Beijerinckiaceae bacterium]
MRGENRRHEAAAKHLRDSLDSKAGRDQALEDGGKAARLADPRLLHSANSTAPDIVPVLGNVGKM